MHLFDLFQGGYACRNLGQEFLDPSRIDWAICARHDELLSRQIVPERDLLAGEVVVGYWGWQENAVSDGQGIDRFDISLAPMSTALSVLGMPA